MTLVGRTPFPNSSLTVTFLISVSSLSWMLLQLTGSLFWGCLFSGVIVGGMVGLITFLVLYEGSIYYLQRTIAFIVGVLVVVVIRVGALCFGRARYFQSFYRKKPAAANM